MKVINNSMLQTKEEWKHYEEMKKNECIILENGIIRVNNFI